MRPLAALLGENAVHTGDLHLDGPVRIDGAVVGAVRSNDLVEVGRTGSVAGELHARQALIAGTIRGRLEVSERITLLETADIEAEVVTPWLDVRLGARLQGMVRVVRPREST